MMRGKGGALKAAQLVCVAASMSLSVVLLSGCSAASEPPKVDKEAVSMAEGELTIRGFTDIVYAGYFDDNIDRYSFHVGAGTCRGYASVSGDHAGLWVTFSDKNGDGVTVGNATTALIQANPKLAYCFG